MIFLTVGTQFPFDRLIKAVDNAIEHSLLCGEVFAQIGKSAYKPRNFQAVASLEKEVFDKRFKAASHIISHAGMGTITMALENQKPLLVMPRLKTYGEVVSNHQVAIARKFEELGHLLAAYSVGQLSEKIRQLKNFTPRKRETEAPLVAQRIATYLSSASLFRKQESHRVASKVVLH